MPRAIRLNEGRYMRGFAVPLVAILALIVAQMLKTNPPPLPEIQYFWLAAYTYDLPSGFLTEGEHTYQFTFNYTAPTPGSLVGQPHTIQVSSKAPGVPENMLLRPAGAQGLDTVGECAQFPAVKTGQPIEFLVAWVPNVSMTTADFSAQVQSMKATLQWDNQPPVDLKLQTSTTSWDPLWNCRPWVYGTQPHELVSDFLVR